MKKLSKIILMAIVCIATASTCFAQSAKQKTVDDYSKAMSEVNIYHYTRERLETAFTNALSQEIKLLELVADSNHAELNRLGKNYFLAGLRKQEVILDSFIILVSEWRKREHIADNPEGSFDLAFAKEASKKLKLAISSMKTKSYFVTTEYTNYMIYVFRTSGVFEVSIKN